MDDDGDDFMLFWEGLRNAILLEVIGIAVILLIYGVFWK